MHFNQSSLKETTVRTSANAPERRICRPKQKVGSVKKWILTAIRRPRAVAIDIYNTPVTSNWLVAIDTSCTAQEAYRTGELGHMDRTILPPCRPSCIGPVETPIRLFPVRPKDHDILGGRPLEPRKHRYPCRCNTRRAVPNRERKSA